MMENNTTQPPEGGKVDKNLQSMYYEQNVRNPYSTDSQSETAYKKGFYEAWEYLMQFAPTAPAESEADLWREVFAILKLHGQWGDRAKVQQEFAITRKEPKSRLNPPPPTTNLLSGLRAISLNQIKKYKWNSQKKT